MARRKQGEAGATRDGCSMPPKAASACGRRPRLGGVDRGAGRLVARRGELSLPWQGRTAEGGPGPGRLPLLQDLRRLALAPGPVVPALLACAQRWMDALQGDPHARNVFGILAWAYDYADDYAGIRRETLALGLREFRLLRALLRRAEAAGELRLGLDGHECARLLAAWLGAAASCVATPYRSGVAAAAVRAFAAGAACADRTAGPGRRRGASGQWRGRGPAQAGRETYLLWRRQGGARHGVALTCCSSPQATC